MRAAMGGHTATVEALIKAGANLDLQTKNGNTALIVAAREGHTATAEALIKAGANLDLQDRVSDSRTSPPPFFASISRIFSDSRGHWPEPLAVIW